jgi:predicted O-linked N-acetylglucosamine transferase (SPINDLY family)
MNLQQADESFLQGDYHQVARLYEEIIQLEPDVICHYWHLGLAYLLQGQEEAAQMTWFLPMAQGTPEEINQWTQELIQVLENEAQRQESQDNHNQSWLIRQHIREIAPAEIDNLLHLIQLSIQIETFTNAALTEWNVVKLLREASAEIIDLQLLWQVLRQILDFPNVGPEALEFAEVCIYYLNQQEFIETQELIDTIAPLAIKVAHIAQRPDSAARLLELCLELNPDHLEILKALAYFYGDIDRYQEAVEIARRFYALSQTLPLKVVGNYLILRGLLGAGGRWQEIWPAFAHHQSLLQELIQEQPQDLGTYLPCFLLITPIYLPYLQENLARNRWLQNQVSQLCQENLQTCASEQVKRYQQRSSSHRFDSSRPLKIGYISQSLRRHSVGLLSRWLFQYHNRESFHLSIYFVNQPIDEFTHRWFVNQVDAVYNLGQLEPQGIADKIFEDQIDILVELDSVTLAEICSAMALKPAPIQVTWLGWDASGLPAIDYFIADPYVLPENAQEYYQETIWQLPKTYIAVDGFEVGVPTLRRDQLGIPPDAVVYLSAQTGFKRHPDTVRLQMQILQQVPNSYFLIKGRADEAAIQQFFNQLAEAEGVDLGRLRFLPRDPNELVHRANLGIADVVLDTYPYNGATTTLETLWMGIPLVTRVGQQFAARNSYAFLTNVGVTEGIAWTDEEYVEWGGRLGKDETLRQQVAWKLKASRQTSPLWNTQKFTREMEKAYQQMWAKYIEASK